MSEEDKTKKGSPSNENLLNKRRRRLVQTDDLDPNRHWRLELGNPDPSLFKHKDFGSH